MQLKTVLSATMLALAMLNGVAAADALPTFAAGMLVDEKGMTLYTFDKDAQGKSNCNGDCVSVWPPVAASADARAHGEFTVVTRDDGSRQWAHKGRPLYLFAGDAKAGEAKGDNQGNVWHVIGSRRAAQTGANGMTTGNGY